MFSQRNNPYCELPQIKTNIKRLKYKYYEKNFRT